MITDKKLLLACKGAYGEQPELEGFKRITIHEKNNSCTIYYNDKNMIVAFAGTDSIKDVIDDAKFIKVNTEFGKIHNGFFDNWNDLEPLISEELHRLYSSNRRNIYITGHSLGGALATLCALNFVYRSMIVRVATFGSPRVGNKTWKTCYTNVTTFPTVRYVHGTDVVTKIPTIFYYHVGKLKRIKSSLVNKNRWGFIRDLFFKNKKSMEDHKIENYIKDF